MSQIKTPKSKRERFFFIDLARLFSMIAIAHFHFHEAFFYSNSHNHAEHGFLEIPLVHYSRFMSFSGYSIVILSYFLIGYIGLSKKKLKQLLFIALAGATTILLVFYDGQEWTGEWDIYPYIAFASLILALLSRSMLALGITSLLFFVAICLPPDTWVFPELQNRWYYNPIFGDYESVGAGSWPLIPWLGISLIPFTIGKFFHLAPKISGKLAKLKMPELFIWTVVLILSSFQWGAFHAVPIGSDFYKFTHLISRIDLFSHIIVVVFFIRLGFVQSINSWAKKNPWVSWVSKLYINKKFFLSYLVIWLVIGLYCNFEEFFLSSPYYFDFAVFSLIPLSEWTCHCLIKGSKEIGAYISSNLRAAP